MVESEIDKKVNAAVVALKKDIDSLLDKVMTENFEMSQQIKALNAELEALKKKTDAHIDPMWEYCPHTTR